MKNKIPPTVNHRAVCRSTETPAQTHPRVRECASEREMVRLLFIAQMCIPTLDKVLLLWPRGLTALVACVHVCS